ncbi:Elongation factor 3 (EF-3) (Eukaryotic elongation factor 3) (eEF3) [Durusdinium trenchii]|uniref:Elongation factor 3 (EF-3) (Eukaryotic elongation factor 3) (EEF3) n=1 Tax=Durusdinium trenchii TaxID=1381693 RepID=A0ABP0JSQ9_9DINO
MSTLQDATSEDWKAALYPVIKNVLPAGKNKKADAEEAAHEVMNAMMSGEAAATGGVQEQFEEDEEDAKLEQLCDCRFSLAYGSRILLNNARLYLKRGMRYGIVAAKSAGKTTLLQSIANGQVEGFPVDKLKTVFVQHDIQASQARMSVTDFTIDSVGEEMGVTREQVRETLDGIGFTDEMKDMPITSLSGGWKMKLALARAMLRKADILLLDEPTNHLDVLNVQWVVDYLTGDTCSNVTSLIVSHDTKFLDNVATHIIHFDTLKLNNYKGNLSKFVERFPEAKAYYDLTASRLAFSFPKPAPLDGVKSRGRPILTMTDVTFTYPGAPKPQLEHVSIRVSMASRVACVGANGAGKSTMIKLLTGELKACKGQVYKHPNCNFAYVAQHAFHHIEHHLDKTPNEYIQWRYSGGEDKEALVKDTVKISEEEAKKMKEPMTITIETEEGKKVKEKRVVEKIIARRKQGKILEYECKFVGKSQDMNMWFPRDHLEDLGFTKLLNEVDRRKAAAEGAFQRVLSQANVEAHLEAVGLDRELSTHNRIRSLSGGQKVKVVLAAATWAQPHLIILDEPTNYLDREALGALAQAINNFEGGVVLITHNQEFADATTRETWVVANHRCDIKGDADWAAYAAEALELAAEEDQVDAAGNKIEKKKLPRDVPAKEKKKMIKALKLKIKNDDDMTDFEEECASEWGLFSG